MRWSYAPVRKGKHGQKVKILVLKVNLLCFRDAVYLWLRSFMWLVSCCTPLLYWGVFTHKKGASHNQSCPQRPFGSVCGGEEFEQKLELMLKIRLSVSKCRTDPTLQTAERNRSDIHGWILVTACVCQERLCLCLKTHYSFFAISSPGISPLQTRWGSAASLAGVPHPLSLQDTRSQPGRLTANVPCSPRRCGRCWLLQWQEQRSQEDLRKNGWMVWCISR